MRNSYGNYVIQKLLKICLGGSKKKLSNLILKQLEKVNDKKLINKWKAVLDNTRGKSSNNLSSDLNQNAYFNINENGLVSNPNQVNFLFNSPLQSNKSLNNMTNNYLSNSPSNFTSNNYFLSSPSQNYNYKQYHSPSQTYSNTQHLLNGNNQRNITMNSNNTSIIPNNINNNNILSSNLNNNANNNDNNVKNNSFSLPTNYKTYGINENNKKPMFSPIISNNNINPNSFISKLPTSKYKINSAYNNNNSNPSTEQLYPLGDGIRSSPIYKTNLNLNNKYNLTSSPILKQELTSENISNNNEFISQPDNTAENISKLGKTSNKNTTNTDKNCKTFSTSITNTSNFNQINIDDLFTTFELDNNECSKIPENTVFDNASKKKSKYSINIIPTKHS